MKKALPVGVDNFEKLIKNDYLIIVDQECDYRKKYSGKSICKVGIKETEVLLNDIEKINKDNKKKDEEAKEAGFGLGMAQWTFERTEKLLGYYKKCAKGNKPTMQECIRAETDFMADEL